MNKKEYSTPEADILRMNAEVNFCASGDAPDYGFVSGDGITWD